MSPLKEPRNTALQSVWSDRPKSLSDSRRTPVVVQLASIFSRPMSISISPAMPPPRWPSVLRVIFGKVNEGTSPEKLTPSTNRLVLLNTCGIIVAELLLKSQPQKSMVTPFFAILING